MADLFGFVEFIVAATGLGKTGLPVAGMVTVYTTVKATMVTTVSAPANATELGGGKYGYKLVGADPETNKYLFEFIAGDATVERPQISVEATLLAADYDTQLSYLTSSPLDAVSTATAVWDGFIEGTLTFKQAFRLMMAVLFGKSSGGGTSTIKFRDMSDSKDRISATVDNNGNRNSVTKDGT